MATATLKKRRAVTAKFGPIATAADLLHLIERLGGIDPARVRIDPQPGTATERDLLRANAHKDGALCELVDGTLVKKVIAVDEARLGIRLGRLIAEFCEPRKLGIVLGADAELRVAPKQVRLPDVSFISAAKWREWQKTKPAIGDFGPDIAVEVLSKSNTKAEMARKRREYFAAGASLVWEVDSRRRTVTVYTSPSASQKLTTSDVLTGGDVLPDFRLPLTELFADPLA